MATVIERRGHTITDDGCIHYDEVPSSYEAADAIAGKRVDRRRNYCIMDGALHESVSWTEPCSGCGSGSEYDDGVRGGCHECGYHGVVRTSMWIPMDTAEMCRRIDAGD